MCITVKMSELPKRRILEAKLSLEKLFKQFDWERHTNFGLTKKAEPPPTRGGNRSPVAASANG